MLTIMCLSGIFLKHIRINMTSKNFIASRYHTAIKGKNGTSKGGDAYVPVSDFYAGKSVFITGGSGFVGKVLIQRLLDTCQEIDKIYVLIREKRGDSVDRRLRNITESSLFAKLRDQKPEFLEKIIPVVGDVTESQLGIKAKDEQTLIDKVSVVFHAAATVKFNEPLQRAVKINLEGTMKVLDMAKRMKNIQAFVYVSTAFSNPDKTFIREVIYPPPAKLDKVYKFLEENHDDTRAKKIINGSLNTYIFAKGLAESYVAENHGDVPAVIIRPSIITPILKDPLPGWMDKLFSVSGLIYNIGAGTVRVTLGDGKNIMDMIPVDYTCNLAIIVAARCERSDNVEVYNNSSGSLNPASWGEAHQAFINEMTKSNSCELPFPNVFYTKSILMVKLISFFVMTIPAHVADFWLLITGKPLKYINANKNAIALRDGMGNLSSPAWLFIGNKARSLSASLSAKDRQLFPCDPSDIDWAEYLTLYSRAVRQYLQRKNNLKTKNKKNVAV